MGGTVWICTLTVVLILIERQSMNVYAVNSCSALPRSPVQDVINTFDPLEGKRACKDGYLFTEQSSGTWLARLCSETAQCKGDCSFRSETTAAFCDFSWICRGSTSNYTCKVNSCSALPRSPVQDVINTLENLDSLEGGRACKDGYLFTEQSSGTWLARLCSETAQCKDPIAVAGKCPSKTIAVVCDCSWNCTGSTSQYKCKVNSSSALPRSPGQDVINTLDSLEGGRACKDGYLFTEQSSGTWLARLCSETAQCKVIGKAGPSVTPPAVCDWSWNCTRSTSTYICKAVTCPASKTANGAKLKALSPCDNTAGSSCVYTCEGKLIINGKQTDDKTVATKCSATGKWSGNDISCTGIDYCQSTPCKNNGTCRSLSDAYSCDCLAGFTGESCEGIDYCQSTPCKNNGTCRSLSDAYSCDCLAGFTGESCEGTPPTASTTTNFAGTPPTASTTTNTAGTSSITPTPSASSAPPTASTPTNITSTSTTAPSPTNESTSTTTSFPTTEKRGEAAVLIIPAMIIISATTCVFITAIAFAIYFLRKRLRSNARTRRFDKVENMGKANLAFRRPWSLPDDELEMKDVMVSPQAKRQPDAGFSKPHISPGDHCQTLDNANGSSDNFYPNLLRFGGATGTQSKVKKELNAGGSTNFGGDPLCNRPPTSLKHIRKRNSMCTCTGGHFCAKGCSSWEKAPNESEGVSQSHPNFTVKGASIDSKTEISPPRSTFDRGGTRIKIAAVYAYRPNSKSDLIHLRFLVYSDEKRTKMRVELAEKERFPDSKPVNDKAFRMSKDNRVITVRLANLAEGWNLDNTDDTQIYIYEESRSGSRSTDACEFVVKPEDGLDVDVFSCVVKFQQEGDDKEHLIYLKPGFTPLKRQSIRRSTAEDGQSDITTSSCLNWESLSNKSEESWQFQAITPVKEDIDCGGLRRKIATVYASRPNPSSDTVYLRFYVYSDKRDSKRRVELTEKERFPDSKPAIQKPFKMSEDNKVFLVKLTDLEKGWNSDSTDDTQKYHYEKTRSGCQCVDACEFVVKPEDGLAVSGFSCWVTFKQEDDDEEHSFYLNPGFTPLKWQDPRRSSTEGGESDTTTSTAQYEGFVYWDHYIPSMGTESVTEEHIYQISPDVGRNWKNLLRSLSMKEKVIENLSVDFTHENITEQCIQGLIKWKELSHQSATTKTLALALHKIGCFDALKTLQKL